MGGNDEAAHVTYTASIVSRHIVPTGSQFRDLLLEGITYYNISATDGTQQWLQARRYREFALLHGQLSGVVAGLPPMPQKSLFRHRFSEHFNNERQRSLELLLRTALSSDPGLQALHHLREFLGVPPQQASNLNHNVVPVPDHAKASQQPQHGEGEGGRGGQFRGVRVSYLSGLFREVHFKSELAEDPTAKVYNIEARIRELTKGTPCPKPDPEPCQEGCALVDWLDDENAGRANRMLSYGWGYEVQKIVDSLVAYCQRNNLDPKDIYVWICCLCVNQHRVKRAQARGVQVPFEEFKDVFGSRVKGIGHVLALLSPWNKPLYVTRVWCVYELFEASEDPDVKLELILPSRDAQDLEDNVSTSDPRSMVHVWERLCELDVEKAQASVESDRTKIFKCIEEGPGFAKVNGKMATKLGDWFSEVCLDATTNKERKLGPMHADLFTSLNNLGLLLQAQGKLQDAEPLFRRALCGRETTLGANHIDTVISVNNLGTWLMFNGKDVEAEPFLRRAAEASEATLGPKHEYTMTYKANVAQLLGKRGKYVESAAIYRQVVEEAEATLGANDTFTLGVIASLAWALGYAGNLAESEQLLLRALEGHEAALGPNHNLTLLDVSSLAKLRNAQGKFAEAEALGKRAVAGWESTLGPTHARTLMAVKDLGMFLKAHGRLAEAEPLLQRVAQGTKKS